MAKKSDVVELIEDFYGVKLTGLEEKVKGGREDEENWSGCFLG